MEPNELIVCRDVSLGYEGQSVLTHLDLTIRAGDYLCIVGDNGSGKSTLLRGLLGLLTPQSGRIERADGILGRYLDHLVRLNLHRRFAVARVALFNRSQDVLFGIVLNQDRLEKAESAACPGSAGLRTEQRKQRQQP